MRRLVLLLCIVLSAAACAGTGTTPTATPTPRPVASGSCLGNHFVIDNVGRSDVEVRFNGNLVTTVNPGQTADIAQYPDQPGYGLFKVPPLPWEVQVTRVTDGAVLLAIHLTDDGTDGRRFEVGDVAVAEAAGVAYC
jgi:hypothetical protein